MSGCAPHPLLCVCGRGRACVCVCVCVCVCQQEDAVGEVGRIEGEVVTYLDAISR